MPTLDEEWETLDSTPESSAKGFDYAAAKKNPTMLSIQFIRSLPDKIITHNDDLYFWKGTHFDCPSKATLKKMVFGFYEANKIISAWKPQDGNNFIDAIKANPRVREVQELDDSPHLINLNNCVYSLETGETFQHDPKYNFSYKIDVDYDPNANDHPNFTAFLESLFSDKENIKVPDRHSIDLVLYIFAYFLFPQIKIETIFLFLGSGANGKSVLIQVMKTFFPRKYVTSLSLNVLSNEDSFARTPLIHSRLNIATEQRGGINNKVDSEEIKKIASGEETTVYRKFIVDPVNLRPKTKILVAANDFPYFNDTTHGIVRRLIMLEFKKKFVLADEYARILETDSDPALSGIHQTAQKDDLIASMVKEKSAIFNTLISYLHKLKANDWRFPSSENSQALKKEYLGVSDVLGQWLEDNYVFDGLLSEHEMTPAITVLREFTEFYEENFPGKRPTHSTSLVGKKIKHIFRDDGERMRKNIITRTGARRLQQVTLYKIKRKDYMMEANAQAQQEMFGLDINEDGNNEEGRDDGYYESLWSQAVNG